MHRSDRTLWAAARTVADLGELTAQWLQRDVREHPGYSGPAGPDPETAAIAGTLAAVNRAGLLTWQSQPGACDLDEHGQVLVEQRAAVEGFATHHALPAYRAAAEAAGLLVLVHDIDRRRLPWGRRGEGIAVTAVRGRSYPECGRRLSRRWLRSSTSPFVGCDFAAIEDVCTGTLQLALVEPDWNRNDRLWPLLDAVAAELAETVVR